MRENTNIWTKKPGDTFYSVVCHTTENRAIRKVCVLLSNFPHQDFVISESYPESLEKLEKDQKEEQ